MSKAAGSRLSQLRDVFFEHWGSMLEGLSGGDRPTVISQTVPDLAELTPTVRSITEGIGAVQVHSRRAPRVECYRHRVRALQCRISTIEFADAKAVAPAGRSRTPQPARTPRPSIRKGRSERVSPPSGVPLRERLISVLQPPLTTLLGDERLWVPAEPFHFQYDGVNFLTSRWSALLADEMGLGKTMQAIMAIRLLLRSGLLQSVLVVCPKPLVTNWMREFSFWAEEIPVLAVGGSGWKRRGFWLYNRSPVKLANYESLARDADLFTEGQVSFDLVVLDEAQRIKNRDSKIAGVVHQIRRKRSWALTGTPVENRASDLVSLLEFVSNERLGGCGTSPHGRGSGWNGDERPDLLRDAVSEVLLRRTKEMVLDDMPPMLVRDTYVDLSPDQRERYEAAEQEGVVQLDELGEAITIEHVFELIRRLKQICNFDPVTGQSAKADQLRADLAEIAASGQKAILFSQWVGTLETLAETLADFRPLQYHGKVPQRRREEILTEFRDNPDRNILLLSYGTGAVGLNIQFSNYVFLFDRWWNPAIEDQAINRAHRIGQKRKVFVSRFLTPGTIEERIAEILERKRELFAFLIDDHEPFPDQGLSREDIFGLFDLKVRGSGE